MKGERVYSRLLHHRQQLSIHLARRAPGFGAAPLVHQAALLPLIEEQLHLPASLHQGGGEPVPVLRLEHLGYYDLASQSILLANIRADSNGIKFVHWYKHV